MTATLAPNSQAVLEWMKVFPKQVTENYTSSVTFMKQLTVVAISTITYLKNVFPEDSYMVESFGGIKLRILKKICRDELAQFLSTALTQAFEAFDKKYLHQLALCFYEDECKIENLIEYHIFEYTYHGDGVTMNVHSKNRDSVKHSANYTFENVKERTIHMIRACVVLMESCQSQLPSTYDVPQEQSNCVRFQRRLESLVHRMAIICTQAPAEYQAPGYRSADEAADHLDATLHAAVRLGWVETPFHKLLARTYIRDTLRASHEAIASQNPPMITQPELDVSHDLSGNRPVSTASELPLRCPCNKCDGDELSQAELLTCQYCNTVQHAACFGILREHAAQVARHCCAACADADRARRPTDARLAPLSAKRRESLCIFRRTLEWCARAEWVRAAQLGTQFALSPPNAAKLMKLLHSQGIILHTSDNDLNTPQKILPEQLKSVMAKFFQSSGEENIVDRLLAETFSSQENHSDPISEVLSPLEKVSLRNASTVGQVVERSALKEITQTEESTLNQYREAILSKDTEEDLANVTEALGTGVQKRTVKRKADESKQENRFAMRTGVRTKRAKAMPK